MAFCEAGTGQVQGRYRAGMEQLYRDLVVMTKPSVSGAKIYPKDAQKTDLKRKKIQS
jgi:hypothetical protein